MTASEMFGVPVKDMPAEVRRRAKAINFGIIYGISAFGLANPARHPARGGRRLYPQVFRAVPRHPRLHGRDQARMSCQGLCHDLVRARLPLSADRLEEPVGACFRRAAGDQRADPGLRRRYHPPRDGPDGAGLAEAGLSTRMLLQVHDELVFEAPEAEVERALPLIRKVMIEAPLPAVHLAVPLQVDARAAANWDEAH